MSLFDLKTSLSELKNSNEGISKLTWDQISASREVTGATFPGRAIHFRFSVAGQRWWVPGRSYMRMRLKVAKANGTAIVSADDVALAPGVAACLFQSAEFRINGKTVSHVTDNLAQIDAVQTRLRKPKSWVSNIGKSANLWEHKFVNRKADQSIDGLRVPEALNIPTLATAAEIKTELEGEPAPQKNEVEIVWQVPLSIFSVGHAIPTGDFELVLNPRGTDYKLAAVESNVDAGAGGVVYDSKVAGAGGNFDFSVDDMVFYAAMVESDPMENGTYFLDLEDIRLQTKTNAVSTSSKTLNFDVNATTHGLTVAFQDDTSGTNTQFPPTKFISRAKGEQKMELLRITYAGQSKPAPDWSGEYKAGKDHMTQRYYETAAYSGGLFDAGGFESKEEWLGFGPMYHFRWPRDGRDMGSTRVDVTTKFSAADAAAVTNNAHTQLLLFDHYKSVASVTIANGRVTDVQLQAL